jgi:hypothetical protein
MKDFKVDGRPLSIGSGSVARARAASHGSAKHATRPPPQPFDGSARARPPRAPPPDTCQAVSRLSPRRYISQTRARRSPRPLPPDAPARKAAASLGRSRSSDPPKKPPASGCGSNTWSATKGPVLLSPPRRPTKPISPSRRVQSCQDCAANKCRAVGNEKCPPS